MDKGGHEPAGNRKIKLRIHLEFLISSESDVSSLRSTLIALTSGTTIDKSYKTGETSEPQSHRDFLVNWFHKIKISTSNEAGAGEKRDEDAHDESDSIWTTEVDDGIIQLHESKWRLAHVRSPFLKLNPQLNPIIASVCEAIRNTRGLTIGLNHIPRLRVEIKPETSAFTITDVRRTLLFLWSASQRLDTLHARYCDSMSAAVPGLEFSRLFSPAPIVYPLNGNWNAVAQTKFTHGPPGKVNMLDYVYSVRGTYRENEIVHAVELSDDLQWLAEGTNAHVWDPYCKKRIVPGAYDFSSLLAPHGGFIRFNQHAGTLDPEAVSHWVRVCCGIVDFGLNATSERLEYVKRQLKLPSNLDHSLRCSSSGLYNVVQLLSDLKLPSQAVYYMSLGPNPFVSELAHRRPFTPAVNIEEVEYVSPYTFGIEMEFLVPYSLVGSRDPDNDDRRWIYRDPSSAASGKSISKDDEKDQIQHYTPWAIQCIKNKALSKLVYSANANRLVSLLTSAGHLSATFDTRADDTDPDDSVVPGRVLRAILNEAGNPPVYFLKGLDPRYQIWHVHRDSTLSNFHGGESGYAGHLGIEVSSPILRDRPADFEKIFDVLKIVRGGVRPMLDHSCGFHVHVGDVRGFSLRGLKKLAILVWVSELVLYSLVHPSREENAMAAPLGKDSILACREDMRESTAHLLCDDIAAYIPMNIIPQLLLDDIIQIWSVTSEYGLMRLLQPDVGCKGGTSFLSIRRNIDKESSDGNANYGGTVKFRMLEGTLDPELIAHWTKLVLRIVEVGTQTEPAEYLHMMKQILKEYYSEEERLEGFLGALGMEEHVPFWNKVSEKNKDLSESDEAADGKNWQYPVDREIWFLDPDEEDEFMRRWCDQNITKVPPVDGDNLERARCIL
ncbi:hypothetical protein LX36DRAFT_702010 [Colletotrichum falcatum]|nr:hypothetical protein LX36DRAFT_702010 [Colletotrichum falcatum]